jgi:hypothetical protein
LARVRYFLLVLLLNASAMACVPAKSSDTTRWGGNESVVIEESKPVARIQGAVSFAEKETLANVLVEVIPDSDPTAIGDPTPSSRRVAACVTLSDGKFELNVPPGKYEVRFSIDSGWDVTHAIVLVRRGAPRRKLKIRMSLGK